MLDVFLEQKNVFHFCRGIVFDLITRLQPTPPAPPDLTRTEIRKQIFEEENSQKGYVFDSFVDKYGLNLFRNLQMILAILKNKELLRFISINNGLVSNPARVGPEKEGENLKAIANETQNRGNVESVEPNLTKKILTREEAEREELRAQNKIIYTNVTSNVVSYAGESSLGTWHNQKTQAKPVQISAQRVISHVFNTENHSNFGDFFWDMNMDSLESLKEQILANCQMFDEKETAEISESIEHRLRILEDACLVRKPESSELFGPLREKVVEFCEFVVREVDEKRAELDLPSLNAKVDPAEEESQGPSKEKVDLTPEKKEVQK